MKFPNALAIHFAILTCAFAAHAGECLDSAKKFGKTSKDVLPGDCIEKTMQYARGSQKYASESGKLQSFGYANILIVRQMDPLMDVVIAGQYTLLENVVATAVDEKNHEVYALDDAANAIYVFDSGISGNVAPKRYLKLAELKGAISIAVDADRGALIVVHPKSVSVYGRLAYNEGRRADQSIKKISSLEESQLRVQGITAATYNPASGFLTLLDKASTLTAQINSSGQIRLK